MRGIPIIEVKVVKGKEPLIVGVKSSILIILGYLPIVMMTFLVNLRHILMSASLSLQFKKTPSKLLPILGFLITDESFAVSSAGFDQQKDKEMFFWDLDLQLILAGF